MVAGRITEVSLKNQSSSGVVTRLPEATRQKLYELYIKAVTAKEVLLAMEQEVQRVCDKYNTANMLTREILNIPDDETIDLLTGEISLKESDKSELPA